MKRNYQQKLTNIQNWSAIVEYHWHRLKGLVRNDAEFWDHTLHSMTDQDWWDWCDIEPSIKIQHEEHYRRYPKLSEDTQEIRSRLMLGKQITRKMGVSKNLTAFRTLMAIHDLVNDIKGTPTVQYTDKDRKPEPELSPFERMFDV